MAHGGLREGQPLQVVPRRQVRSHRQGQSIYNHISIDRIYMYMHIIFMQVCTYLCACALLSYHPFFLPTPQTPNTNTNTTTPNLHTNRAATSATRKPPNRSTNPPLPLPPPTPAAPTTPLPPPPAPSPPPLGGPRGWWMTRRGRFLCTRPPRWNCWTASPSGRRVRDGRVGWIVVCWATFTSHFNTQQPIHYIKK